MAQAGFAYELPLKLQNRQKRDRKKYERELKGTDGGAYLEVDYRGRVKRVIEDRNGNRAVMCI